MQNYFHELSENQADFVLLVLESQGINADYTKDNNSFNIILNETDKEKAGQILKEQFAEARDRREKYKAIQLPLSWKSPMIFTILIMLSLIHFYSIYNGFHGDLVREYGASALYILQGEYFRAVTALMLHADLEHLAGNLVGLFVFGTAVFSLTGYGRGSLMLLLSGFFGNITNAYLKKGLYLSIGASTSVLGAAGILTALQIAKRKKTSGISMDTFTPFAAGMALLGFLSGGENTDISAHLFGFLWGLAIGIAYTMANKNKTDDMSNTYSSNNSRDDSSTEILYASISMIIIIAAFMKYF